MTKAIATDVDAINEINANAITKAKQAAAGFAEVMKTAGRIQGIGLVRHFASAAELKMLDEVKSSKQYVGLLVGDTEIRTWEEFCKLVLGYSADKVNTDLKNLQFFGEEFMEHSQKLGLGYRDLKKLSRLPDEMRAEVQELMVEKDKDELIDLIEEMATKHNAEKERLKKKLTDLEDRIEKVQETTKHQLEAKDKVLKLKQTTLSEREDKIAELEAVLSGSNPKEREDKITADQQQGISDITNQVMNLMYEFEMLMSEITARESYPQDLTNHAQQQLQRITDRTIGVMEKYHLSQDGITIDSDDDFIQNVG
jgi:hypothetical protein